MREDAPLTREPVTARIYVRPAVDGRLGEKILAREILMMAVAGSTGQSGTPSLTDGQEP